MENEQLTRKTWIDSKNNQNFGRNNTYSFFTFYFFQDQTTASLEVRENRILALHSYRVPGGSSGRIIGQKSLEYS